MSEIILLLTSVVFAVLAKRNYDLRDGQPAWEQAALPISLAAAAIASIVELMAW